jgi:hypothetical protein
LAVRATIAPWSGTIAASTGISTILTAVVNTSAGKALCLIACLIKAAPPDLEGLLYCGALERPFDGYSLLINLR